MGEPERRVRRARGVGGVWRRSAEQRRASSHQRPSRHQVAVRRPRRSRACGTHVPAVGGSARRAERGGAELWPLAAPVRRRPVTRRPFHRHQQRAVPRRRRDAEDIPVPRRLRRPLGAGGVHFRGADQRRALPGRGGTDEARASATRAFAPTSTPLVPERATASAASLSTARGRRVAEGRGLRRRADADARAPRCGGRRLADHVRESCQPAAGARGDSRPRDCAAGRAGRVARTGHSPVVDGECRARGVRTDPGDRAGPMVARHSSSSSCRPR